MPKTFVFVGLPEVGNELAPNLLEAGFKAAGGMESADVVFTFTPFFEDTEEVYFGSEGAIARARQGTYLVNLSPTNPAFTREIDALAQVSGMKTLDAPLFVHDVSREHAFADRDNLSMLVGAEEADYAVLETMFASIAGKVVPCGGIGTGQLAKAAATLQRAASVVSLVEADSLCRVAEGAEAAASIMARILDFGAASADMLSLYESVVQRRFSGSYSVGIMLGEVMAALDAANDIALILPQAEAAEYLLQLLLAIGGEGRSPAGISLLYADEAECARNGLDWSRAEDMVGGFDAYDDYEDTGDDFGGGRHSGHHHRDDGFDFDGYSPN